MDNLEFAPLPPATKADSYSLPEVNEKAWHENCYEIA